MHWDGLRARRGDPSGVTRLVFEKLSRFPEKEIPAWLRPVWGCAEEELGRAAVWIICGYSLPAYDTAIVDLLRRAATAGNLRRILVLDPNASEICGRYSAIVQNVQVVPLDGLPEGVQELRQLL